MSNNRITKMMSITVTSCLAALLLQGCGSKVDCNDDKTKATGLDIIQSYLNKSAGYQNVSAAFSGTPDLTNIKTVSRNDELKQASCSATYSFTYNGQPHEIADVEYDLAYLQDKKDVEVKIAIGTVDKGLGQLLVMEHPINNSVQKFYDPTTGNLQHTIEWKNNVRDGVERIYNPATNKLIAEVNVVKGLKTGSEKRWNADGSVLLIDLNWVDGKATGFEKQFSPSGDKFDTDLTWKDGKATGIQTIRNYGAGYEEYHWKDGLYDGIHKVFTMDGVTGKVYLWKMENYKGGKLDGLAQVFEVDGKNDLSLQKTYRDGVEVPNDSQAQAPEASGGQSPSSATGATSSVAPAQ